jgi:hypothetical protein
MITRLDDPKANESDLDLTSQSNKAEAKPKFFGVRSVRLLRRRELLKWSADRLECIPDDAEGLQNSHNEATQPREVVRHWSSVGCDLRRCVGDGKRMGECDEVIPNNQVAVFRRRLGASIDRALDCRNST